MEELLTTILKSIVKNPDTIVVTSSDTDESHVTLSIQAADDDKGLIIGKHGRIIKALGDIINIKGFDEGKRAYLKLLNNEEKESPSLSEVEEE